MLTLKNLKTTYVMRNLHLYVPKRALTWPITCTKGWGNISVTKEKIIIGARINTEAMVLEDEDFLDEDQC